MGLVALSIPALLLFFLYGQSYDSPSSYGTMVKNPQGGSIGRVIIEKHLDKIPGTRNKSSSGTGNQKLMFSPEAKEHAPRKGIVLRHNENIKTIQTTETPKMKVTVRKTRTNVIYEINREDAFMSYTFPLAHLNFSHSHKVYSTYQEALQGQTSQHSAQDRTVILAVVDLGYIEMAVNLYTSSLLQHQLHNYLFVCSESTACEILNALNISAFSYVDYGDIGKTASSYYSDQFRVKTHVKTMAILDALKLGYSVLITDVDIVFFKNPFDYMNCHDCDIEITWDEIEGNSGFYLARNTNPALMLHQNALDMYKRHPDLTNQKTLDRTLEEMSKNQQLKFGKLSGEDFPNGYQYYEKGHRMWYTDFPCSSCVIVHNNWIVSNSAKVYRFKEHHHWFVDKNQYYSHPERKYITYSNPAKFAEHSHVEFDALRSAFWIAHVLNRTLILPQFHKPITCKYDVCYGHYFATYNTFYHVPSVDKHIGEDSYRESSFLHNPLVPKRDSQFPCGPNIHSKRSFQEESRSEKRIQICF